MAEPGHILVVDDERHIRFFLRETLSEAGHTVTTAQDGTAAVEHLRDQGPFDLLLLDIRMPGKDGVEVMQAAREIAPDTVIIMLTGHATVESAVAALREGAHDYLLKPASTDDLLDSVEQGLDKRQRQVRRRQLITRLAEGVRQLDEGLGQSTAAAQPRATQDVICAGPLRVDVPAHEVTLDDEDLHLTPTEFDILVCLLQATGEVVSHQEIVAAVWGHDTEPWEARSLLNPHLTHLRSKLKAGSDAHEFIVNVHGIGYKFESPRE